MQYSEREKIHQMNHGFDQIWEINGGAVRSWQVWEGPSLERLLQAKLRDKKPPNPKPGQGLGEQKAKGCLVSDSKSQRSSPNTQDPVKRHFPAFSKIKGNKKHSTLQALRRSCVCEMSHRVHNLFPTMRIRKAPLGMWFLAFPCPALLEQPRGCCSQTQSQRGNP